MSSTWIVSGNCDVKVPKCEIQFLINERHARKVVIADIDRDVTGTSTQTVAKWNEIGPS